MMTTITKILVCIILPLLSQPFSLVMAVDRNKFRTCSNTSFCRRNRKGRNQPMYSYRILPHSIILRPKSSKDVIATLDPNLNFDSESQKIQMPPGNNKLGAYYQKIKHRFLSSQQHQYKDQDSDRLSEDNPYLTATLENSSPQRTLEKESLRLAMYFYQNGVMRLKVTEEYGSTDATKEPRWTSDDLILNHEEMIMMDKSDIAVLDGKEMEMMKDMLDIPPTKDVVMIQYWNQSMILVLELEEFKLFLYRKTQIKDIVGADIVLEPLMSINSNQLMHFEIRRDKDDSSKNGVEVVPPSANDYDVKDESMDRHGGKDIVGYWEDGLAIYADGTREHRKIEQVQDGSTNRQGFQSSNGFLPDTEGMWEENFHEFTDSKPYGPMSVGMDIAFPSSSFLYGLPEHASSARLQSTVGVNGHYKEPYRLYNLDVFQYELDENMALYGEVPLIISQSAKTGTTGVFWFNPTETFVDIDIEEEKNKSQTHWISESGIIDFFVLPGSSPRDIYAQYGSLTGRVSLPPMFSLGYHQCRWNYRDEKDVYEVHGKFEELDYPYDVLWLDIEHTNQKKYFTWDIGLFPNPKEMQEKLKSQGRNMVAIVDPHIKRDANYYIHKEATSKGLYIKDKTGKSDYDGWCWPGSSSYLDFTSKHVRKWWGDQFAYNIYEGSTPSLYIWNDMNEPSVFNGPEVSMQKDLRNLGGIEHREWHNLYGILFHRATAEGLIRRNAGENLRPFVLSRSFFAGSQRYGAIWTGDNESSWEHLAIATPMLLSLNIAALSFVGADVGGFFGDPDAELMTRWMQAGAYQPFFRGHAHHDSKRREPWVFGDEWTNKMKSAAMARYALLPYWYTVFYEASISGMPVMRAMWMEYPEVEPLYNIENQYLIGSDVLVAPVTAPGVTKTNIIFPAKHYWFDVDTMIKVPMELSQRAFSVIIESGIDKIPVFQRGGSIIPRKLRLRRSTQAMIHDPYTLYVALDQSQSALGKLYIDDESTFDHIRIGNFVLASFSVDMKTSMKCSFEGKGDWSDSKNFMIERIIFMGVEHIPTSISSKGKKLDYSFDSNKQVLVVKKPNVSAITEWEIEFK